MPPIGTMCISGTDKAESVVGWLMVPSRTNKRFYQK